MDKDQFILYVTVPDNIGISAESLARKVELECELDIKVSPTPPREKV